MKSTAILLKGNSGGQNREHRLIIIRSQFTTDFICKKFAELHNLKNAKWQEIPFESFWINDWDGITKSDHHVVNMHGVINEVTEIHKDFIIYKNAYTTAMNKDGLVTTNFTNLPLTPYKPKF